jgi:Icc protein
MIRVDPGDIYDGVGWEKVDVSAQDRVDVEYVMWGRKEVLAQTPADSSKASIPEVLRPRIADTIWPY